MVIEELKLSTRTYNCLKRKGINTAEEIAMLRDEDLMSIRNFGMKCLQEVREKTGRLLSNEMPAIPGMREDDPNVMELCFRNGENNMKEKVITLLMDHRTSPGGFCHEHITHLIKEVESL